MHMVSVSSNTGPYTHLCSRWTIANYLPVLLMDHCGSPFLPVDRGR
jgi:hypothetical protein